jgi:hypothetical protein
MNRIDVINENHQELGVHQNLSQMSIGVRREAFGRADLVNCT